MRRKRRRLQVSTFPFMAVLLCAMGSLILLLLVFDRQAKLAAKNKAREAMKKSAAEAKQRREQLLANQKAEWKKRRRQLHARLLEQHKKLSIQLEQARSKEKDAKARIDQQESALAGLLQRLHGESAGLQKLRADLHGKQSALQLWQSEAKRAGKEVARLAGDLDQLEKTMQDLKTLRRQSGQTYSLVPYRGKRGESRQPIYIECNARGIVFHPDGKKLEDVTFNALNLRRELDQRIRKGRARLPLATDDRPYLFLLIRPDGLGSYYSVQSALVGQRIQFGYELIDQNWVLNFSKDGKVFPSSSSPAIAAGPPVQMPGYHPRGWRAGGAMPNTETGGGGTFGGRKKSPNGNSASRGGVPASQVIILTPGGPRNTASPSGKTGLPGVGQIIRLNPPQMGKTNGKENNANGKTKWKSADVKPSNNRDKETAPPVNATPNGNAAAGQTCEICPNASPRAPASVFDQKPQRRRPAMPLSRLMGNRDWYIPIECNDGEIVLPLSRKRFPLRELTRASADEHALTKELRELIARRQARVRTGEPAYRPIMRFEVTPDGLQSYHLVYPLVEVLGLPMMRENVQPKDATIFSNR